MAVRRAVRALLVTCVAFMAGPIGNALATSAHYGGNGNDTVVVSGDDNADHDIQFRLSSDQAHDEIIDTQQFTSIPVDCTIVVMNTWISCPAHTNVQVDLGAGNDKLAFDGTQSDCFNDYVVNLGDGANSVNLSAACPTSPAEHATVTSGSGPDTLTGGNQAAATYLAGDGDDNVYGGSGDEAIHGEGGNDRLFGHGGNDFVLGEGGNDAPDGGAGDDRVDGGDGNDDLELCSSCFGSGNDPGAGADHYVGGPGVDKLWLDAHPGGVNISLDGAANDGTPGEGDNVESDIEAIEGTTGNDVFTGSAGPDNFAGNSGSDAIHGAGGNDDLYGGGGDDTVSGDAGDDKVQGGPAADTVDGGAGADQIYGDIASCSVFCNSDPDKLLARDGERDTVDCGGGADTATVDALDVVAFCAVVDRPPTTPPPCTSACMKPPPATTFSVAAAGTLRISKALSLVVRCSAACRYKVTIALSAKVAKRFGLGRRAIIIGTASGTLKAAGKKTVKLTLTARARRKLKHATSVAATLRIALTGTRSRSKSITLRH
jgi:Ca2+-binding RTX toxin-like protein